MASNNTKLGGRPSSLRQVARRICAAIIPRRMLFFHGPTNDRRVCLTFDDGPHPDHTPPILDILATHSVRATFFLIGERAERHPQLVRRVVAEGHEIGNHTFSHPRPGTLSSKDLLADIDRANEVIKSTGGATTRLFRPPYGKVTTTGLLRLWRNGQTVVLWNCDSKDYLGDESRLAEFGRAEWARGGDVILMHDGFPHAHRILDSLIGNLRASGFEFSRISEWIGRG